MPSEAMPPGETERLLSLVLDPVWYRARHRDVAASGADPLRHFIDCGLREQRDPNRWFDGAWYARRYPDVAASGAHPLLHYMTEGARSRRDPHPRFDAGWYAERHPEAAGNPLLFHLRIGASRGWLTERPVAIEDWLPSARPAFVAPSDVAADVVIPVYRGMAVTRRCVESVLADQDRPEGRVPEGRVVVIDDASPEPRLSAWLDRLARTGAITLLRNKKNLGFVGSANRGLRHAGTRDVALLNSDTEVPSGWLRRLAAQAYAEDRVASVSPLSNNASICGWLGYAGAPMPDGVGLAEIDAACRTANAGRSAPAPTTVGFCMYIRRAALDALGGFDARTFGKGYGEENDFCLRAAAAGWRHHIACDTFVYHAGGASFGDAADPAITRAYTILTQRYPNYALSIAEFVEDARTEPFRFAATMALFRASGRPTVLVLSHDMDGGVRRGVTDAVARDAGKVNYLVLEPASRGVALSVPALPELPRLVVAAERWRDVAAVARSGGVSRVHIHHLMGLDLDARALIHELGVPFDVTVHDYFAICPQVTLLPWDVGPYCGEPGPAGCDACIAHRPSHGARDIMSWRLRWAWQFHEAAFVFAPSEDTRERLRRHGIGEHAIVVPHETIAPRNVAPERPAKQLRVAVLGTLANHKGAQLVASVVMAADPARLEIQVIGGVEATISGAARARLTVHGPYREGALPALLARYRPHVVWFPAAWPETYSYTLSAAIDAGLPIVAGEIGAFPERLSGRPLTWVTPPTLDPAAWLGLFDTVADALRKAGAGRGPEKRRGIFDVERMASGKASSRRAAKRAGAMAVDTVTDAVRGDAPTRGPVQRARAAMVDTKTGPLPGDTAAAGTEVDTETEQLRGDALPAEPAKRAGRVAVDALTEESPGDAPPRGAAKRTRAVAVDTVTDALPGDASPRGAGERSGRRGTVARSGLVDLRREGATSVVVIPETFDDGSFTPCAYIRLLLPLTHPASGRGLTVTVADAAEAARYQADVIVTQRHALASVAAAERLAAHAARTGATLVFDLDDDLLSIPPEHPEAADLTARAAVVERMIRLAGMTRTSTAALAERVRTLARRVEVVGNALDERIWTPRGSGPADPFGPVRLLCMGTATHDADFALLQPALGEIHRRFGDQIQIDLIGFVSGTVPEWVRRIAPSLHASRSYPGFVNWLAGAGPWDIGLAPLADTAFNRCKSPIKVLDYAALGLATLASDVAAYRGSLADGVGGVLVANTDEAWFEALSRAIRDPAWRRGLAAAGGRAYRDGGTLAALGGAWLTPTQPRR